MISQQIFVTLSLSLSHKYLNVDKIHRRSVCNNKLTTPIIHFTTGSYYSLLLFVKTKNYFLSRANRDLNLYKNVKLKFNLDQVTCLIINFKGR